jgi:intracellular multiplication protein IcmL
MMEATVYVCIKMEGLYRMSTKKTPQNKTTVAATPKASPPKQEAQNTALANALNVIGKHHSLHDGDAILREHARLYQNNVFLRKQIILVWSCVLCLSLGIVFTIWYFLSNYPKTKFIATTNNQAICEVAALDKPSVNTSAVEAFAQEAILEIFRFDYVNFDVQIAKTLNRYFSDKGKQAYYSNLDISGIAEKVKQNKLIARASITRSPQVERESIRAGRYIWQVAVPVNQELYVGNTKIENNNRSNQYFLAKITIIQEQPNMLNPKGIAIDAIVLQTTQAGVN